MRLLKRLALALGGLVALFLLGGLFLPSTWQTERSADIEATPEVLLPLIDTPKRWMEWAPWNMERYPGMSVQYEGEERGTGARWNWTGEDSGKGSMTIRKSDPSGVEFELQFEDFTPSKGAFRFQPNGEHTTVTWSMWGDNGNNLVGRYFALLMDSMLQKDFEAGFTKLKVLAAAEEKAARKAAAQEAAAKLAAEEPIGEGEPTADAAD